MMREDRPDFCFLRVAVLAIAGMAWTVGGASACEVKNAAEPLACCSSSPAPKHGGCCDAGQPSIPAQADAPGDSTTPRIFDPASSSCECRASEPASPADHQSRTPTERFDAEGFGHPAGAASAMGPPSSIARSTIPSERPPKVPLYLQTSRLLN